MKKRMMMMMMVIGVAMGQGVEIGTELVLATPPEQLPLDASHQPHAGRLAAQHGQRLGSATSHWQTT